MRKFQVRRCHRAPECVNGTAHWLVLDPEGRLICDFWEWAHAMFTARTMAERAGAR